MSRTHNVAPAQDAWRRRSAERAIDDPAQLARAARIVRAALRRDRLSIADLTADGPEPSAATLRQAVMADAA